MPDPTQMPPGLTRIKAKETCRIAFEAVGGRQSGLFVVSWHTDEKKGNFILFVNRKETVDTLLCLSRNTVS
jgi:hypothetical protein